MKLRAEGRQLKPVGSYPQAEGTKLQPDGAKPQPAQSKPGPESRKLKPELAKPGPESPAGLPGWQPGMLEAAVWNRRFTTGLFIWEARVKERA